MRLLFSILTLVVLSLQSYAKPFDIKRVEPMNWWVGMKNSELQILVYGEKIGTTLPKINYPGVRINRSITTENPNYLFLYVDISPETEPGTFNIDFFEKGKKRQSHLYELKARDKHSANRKGFNSEDVIYLLMPDRFSNGDPSNDSTENTFEKWNRTNPDGRHGGDIQGIINHLDYLQTMGITAIWSTPLMEDNMQQTSYHTYAITDYYNIDSRYGDNAIYRKLSDEAGERGIKLIMDVVTNHCGLEHWWMKDLPTKDWINNNAEFIQCKFKLNTVADINASNHDRYLTQNGWFDKSMPDLNQRNPLLCDYLAQNNVWWIEYANLGGLRIDTYPYNFKEEMNRIVERVMEEYPSMNIVGECWVGTPTDAAYWQKGSKLRDVFNSSLPSVMDFPLSNAIRTGLTEKEGWGSGLERIYDVMSQDYVYGNINDIMIFVDNHDMDRFSESVNMNKDKYKNGYTLLLTSRGIPQLFYGSELMMAGKGGHGGLRKDFPGGWTDDTRNGFTPEGRTELENEVFNHISCLLKWRKNSPAIHYGNTIQFLPENNVYVYFRKHHEQCVMVIINNNDSTQSIDPLRFEEIIKESKYGVNILNGEKIDLQKMITLEANHSMVIEINENE